MDKFDDMICTVSRTDEKCAVVIDAQFQLFNRAWCIAELAASYKAGMDLQLKMFSMEGFQNHEQHLRSLQIQDMHASRVEDQSLLPLSSQRSTKRCSICCSTSCFLPGTASTASSSCGAWLQSQAGMTLERGTRVTVGGS